MSTLLQQPERVKPDLAQRFVLHDISWEGYEKILEAVAELHNDLCLFLDELSQMDPREAAERPAVAQRLGMEVRQRDRVVRERSCRSEEEANENARSHGGHV